MNYHVGVEHFQKSFEEFLGRQNWRLVQLFLPQVVIIMHRLLTINNVHLTSNWPPDTFINSAAWPQADRLALGVDTFINSAAWPQADRLALGVDTFINSAAWPLTDRLGVDTFINSAANTHSPHSRRQCFCHSRLGPLTFWPQNKWISRNHHGTFLCHVWWS